MYLIPVNDDDAQDPGDDCWRLFTISGNEDGTQDCPFLDQLQDLDHEYQASFAGWLHHFGKLCAAHPKQPMKELINDQRKLHHVGVIRLRMAGNQVVEEKVWQFTHDKIRVLWCYAGKGDRIILLARILLKKQQKTKPADVSAVEKLMQSYIDAVAAGNLKVVGE